MTRRVVYVVCAEGDEPQAELLAGPLERAGYTVAHNGTITVGESRFGEAEKALTSGAPIILCATAKAIGSSWAHRIINAAHSDNGPIRVFVVQMERQAYVDQLALDGKIARYCDDPSRAVRELLEALAKHFPPNLRTHSKGTAVPESSARDFLEQPTESTTFDIDALERFRADLREEVKNRYPLSLTAWEFLARVGVWTDGRLSRTGALLFAKEPTGVCPTSMVKCTRYYAADRTRIRETETFEGTVPDQIIYARKFVADRVYRGDEPSADQAQSVAVYDYPMIAVREIIANALVHRDYSSTDSCVHVRIFSDRMEVSSPGSWLGRDLDRGVHYEMSSLNGQSIKRNFRLAHLMSWIKLVEGEGSGIPSTLRACKDEQSPEPIVIQDQGFVTVVLHRVKRDSIVDSDSNRRGIDPGLPGVLRIAPGRDSLSQGRTLPRPGDKTDAGTIKIGLWGSPASGKTTYLAALPQALTSTDGSVGQWTIYPNNDASTELLINWSHQLTSEQTFPEATPHGDVTELAWNFVGDLTGSRYMRRGRFRRRPPDQCRFDLDLIDVSGEAFGHDPAQKHISPAIVDRALDHLAQAQGLIFLFDPIAERDQQTAAEYMNRTLTRLSRRVMDEGRLVGPYLPHYIAVCITKFDHKDVFQQAREAGLISVGPDGMPRVLGNDAEKLFDAICQGTFWPGQHMDLRSETMFVRNQLRKFFHPDRIRYYAISSIGYRRSRGWDPQDVTRPGFQSDSKEIARFDPEDFSNVIERGGYQRILGPIEPINVLEPLVELYMKITGRA